MAEAASGSDRVRPAFPAVTIGAVQILRLIEVALPDSGDEAIQLARTHARERRPWRTDLYGLITKEDMVHAAEELLTTQQATDLKSEAASIEETPYDTEAGEDYRNVY